MGKGDRKASSAAAAAALGSAAASKTGGTFAFGGCATPIAALDSTHLAEAVQNLRAGGSSCSENSAIMLSN